MMVDLACSAATSMRSLLPLARQCLEGWLEAEHQASGAAFWKKNWDECLLQMESMADESRIGDSGLLGAGAPTLSLPLLQVSLSGAGHQWHALTHGISFRMVRDELAEASDDRRFLGLCVLSAAEVAGVIWLDAASILAEVQGQASFAEAIEVHLLRLARLDSLLETWLWQMRLFQGSLQEWAEDPVLF
jgi:hypothetical protein